MNPQLSALKQHMSMILLFRQVRVQARRVEVSVGLHSRVSRFRGQDPLPCSLSGVGRIHVFSGWWPSVPSHGALSGTAGRFSTASPPGKCMCAGARARRYVRVRMRALRCLVHGCLWTGLSHRWWRWRHITFAAFSPLEQVSGSAGTEEGSEGQAAAGPLAAPLPEGSREELLLPNSKHGAP